jgi:sigma-B regulation protein RsbU (phosphoserine phosphatase)
VILLLDPQAQQLVATSANGLEEEVEQGFRVAVGRPLPVLAIPGRPATLIDMPVDLPSV